MCVIYADIEAAKWCREFLLPKIYYNVHSFKKNSIWPSRSSQNFDDTYRASVTSWRNLSRCHENGYFLPGSGTCIWFYPAGALGVASLCLVLQDMKASLAVLRDVSWVMENTLGSPLLQYFLQDSFSSLMDVLYISTWRWCRIIM